MLALSAFHALRDAVASVGDYRLAPRLDAPATDERILAAVEEHRASPRERRMTDWVRRTRARAWRATAAPCSSRSRMRRGSTPREAGAAMVVTRTRCVRHHRRRPSRVRGDAHRARRAGATRVTPARVARALSAGGAARPMLRRRGDARVRRRRRARAPLAGRRGRVPAHVRRRLALVSRIGGAHGAAGAAARHRRRCVTGSLGDAALDSAAIALARPRLETRAGRRRARALADRRRDDAARATSCRRTISRCWCSATATSAARSCRCWARCRRACAGSTGASTDFPAERPGQRRGRRHRRAGGRSSRDAPRGAFVVVMTHSHALDFAARRRPRSRATTGATSGSSARGRSAPSSRSGSPRAAWRRSRLARVTCPIGAARPRDPQQGARRDRRRRRRGDPRAARSVGSDSMLRDAVSHHRQVDRNRADPIAPLGCSRAIESDAH